MRAGQRKKPDNVYAPASAGMGLLKAGTRMRAAADMLTIREAAMQLDVEDSRILSWSRRQCIAIVDGMGALRLPRWQFLPEIWLNIEDLQECLGTTDSWELLTFLEWSADCLGGRTPRAALELGLAPGRVLAAALAYAH